MLQYDNKAFAFFALSTISFYILPSWYRIITTFYRAFGGLSDKDVGAVVRTSAESRKAATLKKETKGVSAISNTPFLINLGFTIFFTLLFVWLVMQVAGGEGELNSFDPFSILEIDHGADMKVIKKSFREKSLLYHPDKNPNNPAAEAKFMMVAKAYEALTDETAKENYEKYGNPDGKQSLEVSIGLPAFLLETQNQNMVLIFYLIVMVGLVPFCVWTYYSSSSKFGEKDVMYDTYSWFHHTLGENTLMKSLPEFLAGAAEFRKRNSPKSSKEKEQIGALMTKVRGNMQKPKYNHPVCIKGNVLLHSHLLRKTDGLSADLAEDLKFMLKHSTALVDAMISVCQHQDNLKTAITCIEFGQYITQACWVRDSSLLQLPHFTEDEVKHALKGKTAPKTITDYRDTPDASKRGMATFTDEQKDDVSLVLDKLLPDIKVDTKVFVDDDEDAKVYEGDLCTIGVQITRNNLEKGNQAGLVHAPLFPYPKAEAWWIILGTKEGKIISIEKIGDPGKIVKHTIKFLAPKVGTYEFDLFVKSNAYLGLDQETTVSLTTLDNSTLPEYEIHPDDAELDDEPTLFEEILNANVEPDSDSDDDDDDDDDEPVASSTAKNALLKARKAAAAGDDDDSDDDEVEEVYTDK